MIDSSGLMWGWTGTAAAGSSATPAENRRRRSAGYRVLSSERPIGDTSVAGSSRLSTSLSGPRVCLFAVTGYKIVTARALDATDNPQPVTFTAVAPRAPNAGRPPFLAAVSA